MMKKMWMRIQPHIIPEMLIFLKYILPLGILLSGLFLLTDAEYIVTNPYVLWAWAVGLTIAGIYIMRIIAYLVYNSITNIREAMPEIYSEFEQQKRNKKR